MTSTLTPTLVDMSTSLTAVSGPLLPANPNRRSLLIQNISAVNIGVNIDTATAAIGTIGTVTLLPNERITAEGPDCPKNAFTGISASGTAAVTAWETV